ncbi:MULTISPECIES: hypothetical protein [Candidatus Accumulibacter]|jgi:hypothetical protein|nr:hypothetical protein [Candidatus Accumulibacter phosphatis]
MGGIGSGRHWHFGAKCTTEDSRPLDIRRLQQAGVLMSGQCFWWQWTVNGRAVANIQGRVAADGVVLLYRHRSGNDENWQDVEQPVRFDHTPCTYGGARRWWVCPSCGRRVAVLYGPGNLFACRQCYHLVYASQREAEDDRARRQAEKLRRRLGWPAGIANPDGGKPKGMHWRTFERLTAAHDVCAEASLAGVTKWLESMKRRKCGGRNDAEGKG